MSIKEHSWSWDTIAAVGATCTAIIALAFSIWQGYEARHHNRLSVKPLLTFISGPAPAQPADDKSAYRIRILNAGIGPALVAKFQVFYKGEHLSSEQYNIHAASLVSLAALKATDQYPGISRVINSTVLGIGTVIQPGQGVDLLSVQFKEDDPAKRANIISELYDIDIRVTYTSVYGDDDSELCLVSKGDRKRPPLLVK